MPPEKRKEECFRSKGLKKTEFILWTASVNELFVTTYSAGLKQALIDLAAWVEKGTEPLLSTNYRVDTGHVIVPERAVERGGIQPVPVLTANAGKCARVKAGETVSFEVEAEVPNGAGALTFVEWSFEGGMIFRKRAYGSFGTEDREELPGQSIFIRSRELTLAWCV